MTTDLPEDPRVLALNEARDPLALESLVQLASLLEEHTPGTWGVVECLPAQPGRWAVAANPRPHPDGHPWPIYDNLITGWTVSRDWAVYQAALSPTRVKALIKWADSMGRTMNAMRQEHARELAIKDATIRSLTQKLEARRG